MISSLESRVSIAVSIDSIGWLLFADCLYHLAINEKLPEIMKCGFKLKQNKNEYIQEYQKEQEVQRQQVKNKSEKIRVWKQQDLEAIKKGTTYKSDIATEAEVLASLGVKAKKNKLSNGGKVEKVHKRAKTKIIGR